MMYSIYKNNKYFRTASANRFPLGSCGASSFCLVVVNLIVGGMVATNWFIQTVYCFTPRRYCKLSWYCLTFSLT